MTQLQTFCDLHSQRVWRGVHPRVGVQTTGVAPRIPCSQRAQMEGEARLLEGVSILVPADPQLVEGAVRRAAQRDSLARCRHFLITGADDSHFSFV